MKTSFIKLICVSKTKLKKYFNFTFTTKPIKLDVTFKVFRPDAEARRLRQIYNEEERLRRAFSSLPIYLPSQEIPLKTVNTDKSFKSDECVICLSNPPSVLFCNCGHIPICAECDKVKSLNTCPVCKTKTAIKRTIEY